MIRIVRHPDAVVVELPARPGHVLEGQQVLQRTLCQAGQGEVRLVLDCAEVEFVTGAFLSILVQTMHRLGARTGDIVLCRVPPLIRQVFEITRLDVLFPIEEDLAQALASPWPRPDAVVLHAEASQRR